MVGRLDRRLDEFGDNMGRRRLVGIAHPEVDNVLTGAPSLQTQLTDGIEDIGWKSPDSWEIHHALAQSWRRGPATLVSLIL